MEAPEGQRVLALKQQVQTVVYMISWRAELAMTTASIFVALVVA